MAIHKGACETEQRTSHAPIPNVTPFKWALLGVALLVLGLAWAPNQSRGVDNEPTPPGPNPTIDQLLGRSGRADLTKRMADLNVNGKAHAWDKFAAWGRELFENGRVEQSPVDGRPSAPLSKFYKCTHCHNARREDDVLNRPDPDTRAALVERSAQNKPNSFQPLLLAPGTTLWGAVNRESFYNDSFEVYHNLKGPNGKPFNPKSLEESAQICCRYCSVGRFAEPWEIVALLAYFWELEIRLDDLRLPAPIAQSVVQTLSANSMASEAEKNQMRQFLTRLYATKAGDLATTPPAFEKDSLPVYPDHLMFQGDPKIGQGLYKIACDICHGSGKPNESQGADLVGDLKRFYEVIAHGTTQDDQPYMPMFTSQRLSRQQIADIQAYLQSLAGAGKTK